jgi:hypothetical protein
MPVRDLSSEPDAIVRLRLLIPMELSNAPACFGASGRPGVCVIPDRSNFDSSFRGALLREPGIHNPGWSVPLDLWVWIPGSRARARAPE